MRMSKTDIVMDGNAILSKKAALVILNILYFRQGIIEILPSSGFEAESWVHEFHVTLRFFINVTYTRFTMPHKRPGFI